MRLTCSGEAVLTGTSELALVPPYYGDKVNQNEQMPLDLKIFVSLYWMSRFIKSFLLDLFVG